MAKTINKGRDYYREQQFINRQKVKQVRIPEHVKDVIVDSVFALSDRMYEKKNVRNKTFKTIGPTGKKIEIPYQTCTYVRVDPSGLITGKGNKSVMV